MYRQLRDLDNWVANLLHDDDHGTEMSQMVELLLNFRDLAKKYESTDENSHRSMTAKALVEHTQWLEDRYGT